MEKQNRIEEVNTSTSDFTPGESIPMGQAVARATGNDMAILDSLNQDSRNSSLGELFEYATV